jgi:hypothetical protein
LLYPFLLPLQAVLPEVFKSVDIYKLLQQLVLLNANPEMEELGSCCNGSELYLGNGQFGLEHQLS